MNHNQENRHPLRKAFSVLLILTLLSMPSWILASEQGDRFKEIYEKEWQFRLQEFPTLASASGDEDAARDLGHFSQKDEERRNQYWKGIKQELSEISCEQLDRDECINFRLYSKQIEDYLAEFESNSYLIPFNSDWGFYMSWGMLPGDTDFNKSEDYEKYLERIQKIGVVMDEYIEQMRQGIKMGYTQPRVILDGRDEPIKTQLVDKVEDSPFYAPFKGLSESMGSGDRAELLSAAQQVISEDVIPAYQRFYDFFHQEYVPGARETVGAYHLPNGKAFYQSKIKKYATVDMTPQEIHDIGLSEVARIRSEMDAIIEEVQFEGDFEAFLEFLRTDPQFYAKTPKELLAFASYYAKKADGRLPMLFGHLPRQPYGVAPVPDEIAPFFTGGRYVGAPLDAHRGGYYWVNTYALESRTLYTIPALTLHEGAPGHHTQIALAAELDNQPDFRRNDYISAYGEGWGLYAEKLGVEMDIYETPYEHFGRLTYEMWRACRLVIDTGVHAMGWTRQQALDYLSGNTALSMHEVTTEIDRYISWPGQALSYKLGEYTIWQLRHEAEQALGDDFDVRDFHDFVLGLGSVTLDILKDEVKSWIRQQSNA